MSRKLYSYDGGETSYTKDDIFDYMKREGIKELYAEEMVIDKETRMFWCNEFQDFYTRNDGNCGTTCYKYKPRNGKSGICKHWDYPREVTGGLIMLKI